jgi:hypothetical protein
VYEHSHTICGIETLSARPLQHSDAVPSDVVSVTVLMRKARDERKISGNDDAKSPHVFPSKNARRVCARDSRSLLSYIRDLDELGPIYIVAALAIPIISRWTPD